MLRKAVFKGSWYPGALEELDEMVSVEGCGDYRAAVLPHKVRLPLSSDVSTTTIKRSTWPL